MLSISFALEVLDFQHLQSLNTAFSDLAKKYHAPPSPTIEIRHNDIGLHSDNHREWMRDAIAAKRSHTAGTHLLKSKR
jgi:hypothetical protein